MARLSSQRPFWLPHALADARPFTLACAILSSDEINPAHLRGAVGEACPSFMSWRPVPSALLFGTIALAKKETQTCHPARDATDDVKSERLMRGEHGGFMRTLRAPNAMAALLRVTQADLRTVRLLHARDVRFHNLGKQRPCGETDHSTRRHGNPTLPPGCVGHHARAPARSQRRAHGLARLLQPKQLRTIRRPVFRTRDSAPTRDGWASRRRPAPPRHCTMAATPKRSSQGVACAAARRPSGRHQQRERPLGARFRQGCHRQALGTTPGRPSLSVGVSPTVRSNKSPMEKRTQK